MVGYGMLPMFGDNHREYRSLQCEFLGKTLKNPIGEFSLMLYADSGSITKLVQVSRQDLTKAEKQSVLLKKAVSDSLK